MYTITGSWEGGESATQYMLEKAGSDIKAETCGSVLVGLSVD